MPVKKTKPLAVPKAEIVTPPVVSGYDPSLPDNKQRQFR